MTELDREGTAFVAELRSRSEIYWEKHPFQQAMLAGKLGTDTDAIRIAAARAIGEHRRPASVRALGAALAANAGKPEVLKAFIQALQDLDMCSCIPVLMSAAELNKYALAEEALKAIEKIGCVDAAPGLAALLQKAEIEEKKPDTFDGVEDVADEADNKQKKKALAALPPKVRDLLGALTGKSLSTSKEWAASIAGGKATPKRTSVYLCTLTNTPFEAPSSGSKKCPYDGGKGNHDDVFLKHLRE